MTPDNKKELLDIIRRLDSRSRSWTLVLTLFVFAGAAIILIKVHDSTVDPKREISTSAADSTPNWPLGTFQTWDNRPFVTLLPPYSGSGDKGTAIITWDDCEEHTTLGCRWQGDNKSEKVKISCDEQTLTITREEDSYRLYSGALSTTGLASPSDFIKFFSCTRFPQNNSSILITKIPT
jgi:hypothetical protein